MLPDTDVPTAAPNDPEQTRILLVRQSETTTLYTDDVLRNAGFLVTVTTPAQVPAVVNDGIASYSLFVMSHTLAPEDLSEAAVQLRQSHPSAKIILMEGSNMPDVDPTLYDGTLDGLDGPKALIRQVHRLIAS